MLRCRHQVSLGETSRQPVVRRWFLSAASGASPCPSSSARSAGVANCSTPNPKSTVSGVVIAAENSDCERLNPTRTAGLPAGAPWIDQAPSPVSNPSGCVDVATDDRPWCRRRTRRLHHWTGRSRRRCPPRPACPRRPTGRTRPAASRRSSWSSGSTTQSSRRSARVTQGQVVRQEGVFVDAGTRPRSPAAPRYSSNRRPPAASSSRLTQPCAPRR